jgi:adenylosuccinate lyase
MKEIYENPLVGRYASTDMLQLFSPDRKFRTWRQLWIALAETQKELGLAISDEQIAELKEHAVDIDYAEAQAQEARIRHDVMAHVRAYGEQCPKARGIIHLGATSCYVGDNTDLILMAEGLRLIQRQLATVIGNLAAFARRYQDLPALGFTHFQPAQPVTVGKRAVLWIADLILDWHDLAYILSSLSFLGSKGTTGTQASFLSLFDGDHDKCRRLDQMIAERMGFASVCPVSGQTYSRKTDSRVLNVLSGIAQSAAKFSNDLRLLQHLKEVEEPFEEEQIGSSAMAYKRNPMRCERIASLARFVIVSAQDPAFTAASQWLERTLDDSANKRLVIPEAFLACDAILNIYTNVSARLVVYPEVIRRHLQDELPFMATENILMAAVRKGGDRQALHEKIRVHSQAAADRIKMHGESNDLLERIAADPAFSLESSEITRLLDPAQYTGRAAQQTAEFLKETVEPLLTAYHPGKAGIVDASLKV